MATFIVRRIIAAFFITLGATFIAFILVANAGDPLANARGISNPQQRSRRPSPPSPRRCIWTQNILARYFLWLKGVLGCFVGQCDFGQTITQQEVTPMLASALGSSLKLITASTIAAVFLGIAIGIVSALRQYSGLDYTVTFLAFLFFALPVFFIGVILKDLLAIRFNDFLTKAGGAFSWAFIFIFSAVMGLIGYSLLPGEIRRRLAVGASVFVVSFGALYYITVSHWLLDPSLGIVVTAILSVLLGLGVTVLTAGLTQPQGALHLDDHGGGRRRPVVPAAVLLLREHEPPPAGGAAGGGHRRRHRRRLRIRRRRQGPVGPHRRTHRVHHVLRHLRRPAAAGLEDLLGEPGRRRPTDQDPTAGHPEHQG